LQFFKLFVLVSLCVVLVAIGVSEDDVDPEMKMCWANEKSRRRNPTGRPCDRTAVALFG
jgi:hypothetical protein